MVNEIITQDIMETILTGVFIPIIISIGGFICQFFKNKADELKTKRKIDENSLLNKYIELAEGYITTAIVETNQTYVDSLKNSGTFDAAAQKMALFKTKDCVMSLIDNTTKDFLSVALPDFEKWITATIERITKEVKS